MDSIHKMTQPKSSNGSGVSTPRRYVGRSGVGTISAIGAAAPIPFPRTGNEQAPGSRKATSSAGRVRTVAVPWSFRLAFAVTLVLLVFFSFRSFGLFTGPMTNASSVELTYAASVNVLAGRIASPLEAVRLLPPPAAWYGGAPALPASSLPVFVWASAALSGIFGDGLLAGRILALLASLAAGTGLFALVRRSAGARAAIYALLFYSVAPLSVVLGQQYSQASLIMAMQAGSLLALFNWRSTVRTDLTQGSGAAFVWAVVAAVIYALLDPGRYSSRTRRLPDSGADFGYERGHRTTLDPHDSHAVNRPVAEGCGDLWQNSPNRGRSLLTPGHWPQGR